MSKITIVGAGMMGSALAFPARENGHQVHLVGTHLDEEIIETARKTGQHPKFVRPFPEGIRYHQLAEIKDALNGADLVICGVSSFGVDWFAEKVHPLIPESTPVLSVTKGLIVEQDGTMRNYLDYWEQKAAPRKMNLNAVGGACTSYELVAHDHTIVTYCGRHLDTLASIRDMMKTDYYHINISEDIMGVEAAVALKNAYSIGVTIAIGLNEKENGQGAAPHYNSQAAIFYQSVKEMRKLLIYLIGTDEQIDTGTGDMYVTIFGGRTRLMGMLLGRGFSMDEALKALEGITLESLVIIERMGEALGRLIERKELDAADYPLLLHMYNVVTGRSEAEFNWESFVN